MELELEPFPSERFAATRAVLERGVAEGVAPGFVAGLWCETSPREAWVASAGRLWTVPPGADRESPAMTPDTVFDLASVTKVMGTATLIGRLRDRGWVRWNDPVRAFLPGFQWPGITLAHLLSHTSGLPAWIPLWQRIRERARGKSLEEISIRTRQAWARDVVMAVPPDRQPGQAAVYSDLSFLLLGFIAEELTGRALDRAVESTVWSAMGMETAFYRRMPGRSPVPVAGVAPTESCPWRKRVLQAEVHDDNCWSMGGYAGHAGAFGDVRAVLEFARALFNGFLTRETLADMWTRVAEPLGCERTLGWDTPSGNKPASGQLFSPRSVGHLGYTGTSLWIDPDARLVVSLLSNRVHPTRGQPDEIPKIRAFRPLFHDTLRKDLGR